MAHRNWNTTTTQPLQATRSLIITYNFNWIEVCSRVYVFVSREMGVFCFSSCLSCQCGDYCACAPRDTRPPDSTLFYHINVILVVVIIIHNINVLLLYYSSYHAMYISIHCEMLNFYFLYYITSAYFNSAAFTSLTSSSSSSASMISPWDSMGLSPNIGYNNNIMYVGM